MTRDANCRSQAGERFPRAVPRRGSSIAAELYLLPPRTAEAVRSMEEAAGYALEPATAITDEEEMEVKLFVHLGPWHGCEELADGDWSSRLDISRR